MISPVVVKLTLRDMETAGNVVGRIYAVSTLGQSSDLCGRFLLIPGWDEAHHFGDGAGTHPYGAGMGFPLQIRQDRPRTPDCSSALLVWGVFGFGFKAPLDPYTNYYKESDYFTLKVKEATASDGKTPLKALVLDNLTHSYVNLKDPLHIEYKYEKIYAEVLKWRFAKETAFRSLTIGGEDILSRYMEVSYPNASIDVVEIDPEITRVVYDYLGLPRDTRIRTFNEDGRWHVMNCKSGMTSSS